MSEPGAGATIVASGAGREGGLVPFLEASAMT